MIDAARKNKRVRRLAAAGVLGVLLTLFAGCPSTDNLYGQAYSHFIHHEEAQALALLVRIIERDARYIPAYVLEAAIYETRGDWQKSEEVLRQAKQAAAPSSVVCYNLGNAYFKKGEYEKAAAEYTQALALNPAFHEAYINRANSYMGLKRYAPALKDYETFLGLTKKDYPNVRALAALLRRDLGLDPPPAPVP